MTGSVDLLPMAEFACGNSAVIATSATPFYANYGRHLSMKDPWSTNAQAYTRLVQGAIGRARQALQETHARMAMYAGVSCNEAPRYRDGDAVMLFTKNLWIKWPSKKLDHKPARPPQVKECHVWATPTPPVLKAAGGSCFFIFPFL